MRVVSFRVVVACLMIIGCGKEEKPAESRKGPDPLRPPGDTLGLKALYDSTDLQNYRSWDLFPGTKEFADGAQGLGPHGRYVTTYANPIAIAAVSGMNDEMPDGTLLVKDAFDSDKNLRATVLMAKANGEWSFGVFKIHGVEKPEFSRYGLAGSAAAKSCNDCHLDAVKDRVFGWGEGAETSDE